LIQVVRQASWCIAPTIIRFGISWPRLIIPDGHTATALARFLWAANMCLGFFTRGRLWVEMGIGGLILWLAMAATVVLSAWKVVCKLKGSPWFPIGFMIFLYSFLLLFPMTFAGMQPYQDFIMNAYLWLLLGILFRLPQLALSAQFAATAAAATRAGSRWIR
jgi:hypothetical protein